MVGPTLPSQIALKKETERDIGGADLDLLTRGWVTENSTVYEVLQILTVVLVAASMAFPLAHALELPGKLRLGKEEYLAVQPIYYPGFTIGGLVGELGGLVATLALVVVTPRDTPAFWLTLSAFVALLVMHLLYWVLTHPVNNFWLKDFKLNGAGFFRFDPLRRNGGESLFSTPDWKVLRDRWENSHVARAVFAVFGLILLAAAIVR